MNLAKMLNPVILSRTPIIRRTIIDNFRRTISTTSSPQYFHEERRSGYPDKYDRREPEKPKTEREKIREHWDLLKDEVSLIWNELKTTFKGDPKLIFRPDEIDIEWRFEGDPKILDQFIITVDSDYNEGNSSASIQLTKTGRGIFSGFVDTTLRADGKTKRTGFCNLSTVRRYKSLHRKDYLQWENYTHLVMRIRGDGRNYLLVLGCPGEFDLMWNDTYHYVLYTRGGPYWQDVRIPFSKFFLVSKGRVQDIQQPPPMSNISTFSITAAQVHGNFKLEIDYIGVEYDPGHEEEHAYEMYRSPHKFVT